MTTARAQVRSDPVLYALLALALLLRVPSLFRALSLDEFATLEVLRAGSFSEAMQLLRIDTHLPGYFAPLWIWSRGGLSTLWLRMFSLLIDAATLVGLAAWGRSVGGQTARVAVLLWGAMPLALRFSTEIRPYVLLTFLTLASAMAGERLRRLSRATSADAMMTTGVWCWLTATHQVGFLVVTPLVAGWLGSALLRRAQSFGGRLMLAGQLALRLGVPFILSGCCFAACHWGFTCDPSGARVGWMPPLSLGLIEEMFNYSLGLDRGVSILPFGRPLVGASHTGSLLFLAACGVGLASARGRPWAIASLSEWTTIAAITYVKQPIFWYRSIVPSLLLAVMATAASCARLRRGTKVYAALGLGLYASWAVACWVPRAMRPIDPTEQSARLALDLRQQDEPLFVFPDWMRITVDPLTTEQGRVLTLAMTAAPRTPLASGVAIIRCNESLIEGATGLGAQLEELVARGAALHDVVLFLDDDDDMYPETWKTRKKLSALVSASFGPCDTVSEGRIVHLRCRGGMRPRLRSDALMDGSSFRLLTQASARGK